MIFQKKYEATKSFKKYIIKAGTILFICFFCIPSLFFSCNSTHLAKPSAIQYRWHEQERIMFVCLDPCTWQGREYDNHSLSLNRINPEKLNTDQWCEVAQLWGAKEILFVAKHTGGFCWWQTETTDYGIRNTPFKDGKGDVIQDLSESCKKYGLNLGIYVYPGDETWGAGIGSGGQTKDPSRQEAYNAIFRKQLTEVLTRYGHITEVWFDGSCKIDVSDILEKHASNSVIFQGPKASLRWPGTESGKLFYPAWNSLKSEDLKTGVSTQIHSDPNGDAWAPLEADTPLYEHFWFWSPEKAKKSKSLEDLMECYYKSVGYGGVLLLNSTPDTTGLIPENDMKRYKAFGEEIDRRFKNPLATSKDKKGTKVILHLPKNQKINHVVTMEDYRKGERIRKYTIEGFSKGTWKELCRGQSIGRKKIDYFPEAEVSKIRLRISDNVGVPLIRRISAYYVENFTAPPEEALRPWSEWKNIANWSKEMFSDDTLKIKIDLSERINLPGQYTVQLVPEDGDIECTPEHAEIHYEGEKALDEFVKIKGNEINISRTAQVTKESSSILYVTIVCNHTCNGNIEFRPAIIY